MVFGAYASTVGFSPAAAAVMSAFVFAGTAQFAAVGLAAQGAAAASAIALVALINSRYLLLSAAALDLARKARASRGERVLVALGVVDESYALQAAWAKGSAGAALPVAGLLAVPFVFWLMWVGGTLVGALAGRGRRKRGHPARPRSVAPRPRAAGAARARPPVAPRRRRGRARRRPALGRAKRRARAVPRRSRARGTHALLAPLVLPVPRRGRARARGASPRDRRRRGVGSPHWDDGIGAAWRSRAIASAKCSHMRAMRRLAAGRATWSWTKRRSVFARCP